MSGNGDETYAVNLTPHDREILKRGGADGVSTDDMVLKKIVELAPNISKADLQEAFIQILMMYGEDALAALEDGAVQFQKVPTQ